MRKFQELFSFRQLLLFCFLQLQSLVCGLFFLVCHILYGSIDALVRAVGIGISALTVDPFLQLVLYTHQHLQFFLLGFTSGKDSAELLSQDCQGRGGLFCLPLALGSCIHLHPDIYGFIPLLDPETPGLEIFRRGYRCGIVKLSLGCLYFLLKPGSLIEPVDAVIQFIHSILTGLGFFGSLLGFSLDHLPVFVAHSHDLSMFCCFCIKKFLRFCSLVVNRDSYASVYF